MIKNRAAEGGNMVSEEEKKRGEYRTHIKTTAPSLNWVYPLKLQRFFPGF
jgi:hypothetical protein